MFSPQHPRTTTRATLRRLTAVGTTLALGAGFTLAGAAAAQADTPAPAATLSTSQAWAQGRFLSGTVLGMNLDQIVALAPATASNDGTGATQTQQNPLQATALNTITVGTGQPIQADLGGVVQLGAAGQFAQANAQGQSYAAAGGVTDGGGVGIGQPVGYPAGSTTVNLQKLLGTDFASNILDLQLAVKALAAEARADVNTAKGSYTLAGLTLDLSTPAIAKLVEKVDTALAKLNDRMQTLVGKNGALAGRLNTLLQRIDPNLNLLGSKANVTATIDTANVTDAVHKLLTTQYGNDAVSFNLETGKISIDLAKLLGQDLNNLPAGTELLSSPVVDQALQGITGTVSTLADQIVNTVTDQMKSATVTVHADTSVAVPQAAPGCQVVDKVVNETVQVPTQVTEQVPVQSVITVVKDVVKQVPQTVNKLVDTLVNVDQSSFPALSGLPLGSLTTLVPDLLKSLGLSVTTNASTGALQLQQLKQVLTPVTTLVDQTVQEPVATTVTSFVTQTVTKLVDQTVSHTVQQSVCDAGVTAPAPKTTSAVLDVTGTLGQLIGGQSATSALNVQVNGTPNTALSAGTVVNTLGSVLDSSVLATDGGVGSFVTALNDNLVTPAVNGLLGDNNAVAPALSKVLSLKANVKSLDNGTFTQTALQVSALGGDLATLSLGTASVGPNVTGQVGDETITAPETPTDPSQNPLDVAGSIDKLAYTGAGILWIVATLITLLTVGAFLLREGYRRRAATRS